MMLNNRSGSCVYVGIVRAEYSAPGESLDVRYIIIIFSPRLFSRDADSRGSLVSQRTARRRPATGVRTLPVASAYDAGPFMACGCARARSRGSC